MLFGEEKVTVTEFGVHQDAVSTRLRSVWQAVTQLQDNQDEINNRLDRYATRLTAIMRQMENFQGVVDHNALQGEKANEAIREAFRRFQDVKDALNLLATEVGVELTVLPEVPAEVTVQPGLPARLGVEKLTKAEKKEAQAKATTLPAPLTLTQAELNSGLRLVR